MVKTSRDSLTVIADQARSTHHGLPSRLSCERAGPPTQGLLASTPHPVPPKMQSLKAPTQPPERRPRFTCARLRHRKNTRACMSSLIPHSPLLDPELLHPRTGIVNPKKPKHTRIHKKKNNKNFTTSTQHLTFFPAKSSRQVEGITHQKKIPALQHLTKSPHMFPSTTKAEEIRGGGESGDWKSFLEKVMDQLDPSKPLASDIYCMYSCASKY